MAVSDPIAPARFCTNCGRPRLGGARFCVGCGREFDVAAVSGASPPGQFLDEDAEPARPYPVTYRASYVEHPSRAGTIFRLVLALPHLVVWPLLAVVSTCSRSSAGCPCWRWAVYPGRSTASRRRRWCT